MPLAFRIYWATHYIALESAILISIVYWTLLHSDGESTDWASLCFRMKWFLWFFFDALFHLNEICSFSNCSDSLEFREHIIACSEFDHHVFRLFHCRISIKIVSCDLSNCFWTYLCWVFIYLLHMRWNRLVSVC